MTDILEVAESYLKENAAESGADVLLRELIEKVRWQNEVIEKLEGAVQRMSLRTEIDETDVAAWNSLTYGVR